MASRHRRCSLEAFALKLIYRGAEADLFLGSWAGLKSVYKWRKPLPYRLKVIDDEVRRHRTVHEAQMVRLAKLAEVRTPRLYHVDPRTSTLVMEYLPGRRLKEQATLIGKGELAKTFSTFGRMVGRLHKAGISHGDLTTSNIICDDGDLSLIDFGLSFRTERTEDHAVDLRLVKETLTGAHSEIATEALRSFVEGYGLEVGEKRRKEVLRQLSSIERRGRYARVE
jgi:TP53 regulating kinase-like protein